MKELVEILRSSLFVHLPFLSPPHFSLLPMILKSVRVCLELQPSLYLEPDSYFYLVFNELYKLIVHILRI